MKEILYKNRFRHFLTAMPIRMLTAVIVTVSLLYGMTLPTLAALPAGTAGESTANPVTTEVALINAIAVASPGDDIHIDAATITLTGHVDIPTDGITFIGAGQTQTELVAAPGFRHFMATAAAITATFENMTLQGPASPAATDYNGGVMLSGAGSTVIMNRCTVTGNENNTAPGAGRGGGVYAETARLTACTVSNNKTSQHGGGVFADDTAELFDCTVSNNQAGENGGGVYAENEALLTKCTLSANRADHDGGGVIARNYAYLIDCTVYNNRAGQAGGGVRTFDAASVAELINCTVRNNQIGGLGVFTSYLGAGVSSQNDAKLENCTVNNNTPTSGVTIYGGGVYANRTATLICCTVRNNSAGSSGVGAGVYADVSVNIYGSIVTDEVNLNNSPWPASAPSATNNYNIIGSPGGYTTSDIFGTASPTLAYNGGITQTFALPFNSTARYKIPVSETWLPPSDQRGYTTRLGGDFADIGAYNGFPVTGSNGSGTAGDPYIITTPGELDAVRNELTAHYMLGNDIDLTAYLAPGGGGYAQWGASGWMPLGLGPATSIQYAFTGGFDGAGYTVSGLWIDRQTGPDSECVGLFGHVVNATIENLGVVLDPAGIIGGYRVGGLVGRLAAYSGSSVNLKNCYVIGDVTGTGGNRIGGLVGGFSINPASGANPACNGIIENCYSAGTVTGNSDEVGGLIGYRFSGGVSEVRNCYSTCDVTGSNYVGGLVGHQQTGNGSYAGGPYPSTGECNTTNCYTTGDVVSTAGRIAGGLIGREDRYDDGSKTEISGCFTTGNVTGGATNTGGIVGLISETNGTGTITLTENYRYTFANTNGNPTTSFGGDFRDGDSDATAVDFMTDLTYATTTYLTSAWPFGAGGSWSWDDAEKYPMLNLPGEEYPFPFYMITYNLDGGVMPSPLSAIQDSYDPKNAQSQSTPYTLPVPTKTGYSFGGWYDNAGLMGTPVTDITASDSGHKVFFAKWEQATTTTGPTITGPTGMTLNEGYAATSTGIFTTTGSPAPTVVKTSGDAAITWNNTTKQLDIAAGLAVGTYAVVLTASNGISPDATITFILTVQKTYTVTYHANGGTGTQVDPDSPYPSGSAVTVLDTGAIVRVHYVFTHWNTRADDYGISYVPGDVFTIDGDVALYAQWKEYDYIDPILQRTITIDPSLNGRIISDKQYARTRETVTLTILPATDFILDSITVRHARNESLFIPLEGDGDVRTFLMPPFEVIVSSTFKPYSMTAISEIAQSKALQASVLNGVLHVGGLTAGSPLCVYNLHGTVVYHGMAVDETEKIQLPSRGIYIVSDGKRIIKVVN